MRARRGLYQLLVVLFLTAAVSFSGFSQSTTLLRGTVTDPQGGTIAGAVITLSDAGTGSTARSTLTSAVNISSSRFRRARTRSWSKWWVSRS